MIPGNDWAGRKTKKTRYVPKDAISGEESQALSSIAINKMIDHMVKRKAVVSKMFHEVDADRSGTVDMEELGTALPALPWPREQSATALHCTAEQTCRPCHGPGSRAPLHLDSFPVSLVSAPSGNSGT